MAYRVIAFAFPIWTFAVIAGAIWAQERLGPLLGLGSEGDVVVHHVGDLRGVSARAATRAGRGGRRPSIALVGFVSLLITYYAVNLWIVGLHSYKGF